MLTHERVHIEWGKATLPAQGPDSLTYLMLGPGPGGPLLKTTYSPASLNPKMFHRTPGPWPADGILIANSRTQLYTDAPRTLFGALVDFHRTHCASFMFQYYKCELFLVTTATSLCHKQQWCTHMRLCFFLTPRSIPAFYCMPRGLGA